MKKLINMNQEMEIGYVDWEFIYDMQGVVPEGITNEMIMLDKNFIARIPEKWKKFRIDLSKALSSEKQIYIAIADVEKEGNDFKIQGVMKKKGGSVLPFHKVIVMDKDIFEDDYIGSTVTDEKGEFRISFDEETFVDFSFSKKSKMPDLYFKIFEWRKDQFYQISKVMPSPLKVTKYKNKKTLIEFGIIEI